MPESVNRHVVFDDDDPGASDDECPSVEVTFDPSSSFRRKSSMVSSEIRKPALPPRPVRRDECIVHQFLESQRRAAKGGAGSSDAGSDQCLSPGSPSDNSTTPTVDNHHHAFHPPGTDGLGPHGAKNPKSRAIVELKSLEKDVNGQADQQAWTREMTKSLSELDLTQYEDVHSRTLTKKQLSDMAWGVRELSRRLSSMRIRFRVKSVFLLTKVYDQDLIPKTREVTLWLLDKCRDVRYTVYVQDTLRTNKKFDVAGLVDEAAKTYGNPGEEEYDRALLDIKRRLKYWDEEMCRSRPQMFDFVITLGGDGTVLYASWLFQRIVPPVLSFALGSLGFLTKFDFDDFAPTLESAFSKGVTVSLRLRFEGTVMRSKRRSTRAIRSGVSDEDDEDENHTRDLVEELIGEEKEDARTHRPDGTYEILNEIVVDRGPNPTMSYTELFGDDEHFTSILADGICVSTPTGSTAYNLAAGGSLCHPENPVMLVTSICAHTLSFRPIILPDTIVLRVGVPYDARTSSWASFDGRERVELKPGDYVTISASRYPFATVQAEGRRSEDWINSISGKLGWNTRQKQKSFKDVPFFPEEDSKLRATSLSIRRGGNCPNSLEVLQQILVQQETVGLYLITCLPSRASSATRRVIGSFGEQSLVNLDHCLYREAYDEAASSYVIRGERSSSRTIINYNDLPEMTPDEFKQKAGAFDADQETWWHFEGRIPDTTLSCIRHVRKTQPKARISVEVEKPGRPGLPELAAEADVVFYSRSWAEGRGYQSPEAFLRSETPPKLSLALCTWGADGAAALSRSTKEEECFLCPVPKKAIAVIDPVGAGDTFIGGMLYGLVCQSQSWDVRRKVEFAVGLATRKVQQEGFGGLDAARTWG